MSLGKRDIEKNISSETHISLNDSKKFLNIFIDLIKKNSIDKKVKLSNFGSFFYKETPMRIGRNPKTKEEYTISKRSKLNFKATHKVKNLFNESFGRDGRI